MFPTLKRFLLEQLQVLTPALGYLAVALCVSAAPPGPATGKAGADEVGIGVFVQSFTWDPRQAPEFPVILHCWCRDGSRYEGRKLDVIDGRDWQGSFGGALVPSAKESAMNDGKTPQELCPPYLQHAGSFLIWFYDYRDAAGNHLDSLGDASHDGALYPGPAHPPERSLVGGDGAFFLTSLDSSDTFIVLGSKVTLRAFVVLDGKIAGRSDAVSVDVLGAAPRIKGEF